MNIASILEFEEGFREKPYLCSEGYVTIGLGTKLHNSKGMNPAEFPLRVTRKGATDMLELEIDKAHNRIMKSKWSNVYQELTTSRQTIILSMAYQMGGGGVLKFTKMWTAMKGGDFAVARDEALDSRWAKQTPARAIRHATVLMNSNFDSYQGHI